MIYRLVLLITLLPSFAHANNFDNVFKIVDKYLSTVTCQDHQDEDSLRIFQFSNSVGDAATNAVVWSGDKGCYGGSGTSNVFVTPVVRTPSGRLVVANDGELRIQAREFKTAIMVKNNLILLEVPKYEENDPNCCPSGSEIYYIQYDEITQSFQRVEL